MTALCCANSGSLQALILDRTAPKGNLYDSPSSAERWQKAYQEKDILRLRKEVPVGIISLHLRNNNPQRVVFLGSGDGIDEARLFGQMRINVPVVLLDRSKNLLTVAHQFFCGEFPATAVTGIQGNFYELNQCYRQWNNRYIGTCTYLMMGNTFANIEEEKLLTSLTSVAKPGDQFAFSVPVSMVNDPADIEDIRRNDGRMRSGELVPKGTYYDFFASAYDSREEVQDLQLYHHPIPFSSEEGSKCSIPGSYAVEIRSRYNKNGEPQDDSVIVLRRYTIPSLKKWIEDKGWEVTGKCSYHFGTHPMCFLVCKKK